MRSHFLVQGCHPPAKWRGVVDVGGPVVRRLSPSSASHGLRNAARSFSDQYDWTGVTWTQTLTPWPSRPERAWRESQSPRLLTPARGSYRQRPGPCGPLEIIQETLLSAPSSPPSCKMGLQIAPTHRNIPQGALSSVPASGSSGNTLGPIMVLAGTVTWQRPLILSSAMIASDIVSA